MTYQLLIRLLSPLVVLITLLDGLKRQAGASFVLKRFGFFLPKLKLCQHRIWIHCASVGEVKAAQPLIQALINSRSNIIVTTNTASAQRLAKRHFQDQVNHAYCPLDYPFAITRFLDRCHPTQLLVVETEIWPNLFQQCDQKQIGIHIINGRLSSKTLNAPSWLKQCYKKALKQVNQILAKSQNDADHFIKLGASANNVSVLGTLKFAQQHLEHFDNPIGRDYLLAASTHEDEERQIIHHWLTLQRPELLVIVPRHPNRSRSIQKALVNSGCLFKVASLNEKIDSDTQVYLDDRIGFLLPLYEHAKLVVMGGSFVSKGGHNFIEPAFYKKAILTGPDNSNFNDECQLLKDFNGIIQCQNYSELSQHINRLLNDPEQTKQLGEQACQAIETQKNILDAYLKALDLTPKPL